MRWLAPLGFLTLALLLRADPAPIEGAWHGAVAAPQGALPIGLRFARLEDGRLSFGLHMPLMHVHDRMIGPFAEEREGGVAVPLLDIQLRREGDRLTGTFGKAHLPLALTRGEFTADPVPAPVEPPAPVRLWRHDLGAPTLASPLVHNGTVYVGTRDGRLHAVGAGDGTVRWIYQGPHRIDGRAVIAGDALCFVDGRVDLVCLGLADGVERWRTPLHDEAIAGGPAPDNATFNRRTATPLVADGLIHVGSSDGGLYTVEAATGTKLRRLDAGAPVFTGAAQREDGSLLVGTMAGDVVQFAADGREVARWRTGGAVTPTPVVAGGLVIAGSRDYLLHAFELRGGAPAWRYSFGFSWVESTPALRDGVLYVGGSDWARVSAFDPATGRPHWEAAVGGMSWGTPVVMEDTVFAGAAGQRGALIAHRGGVVALDRRTGAIKWRHPLAFADEQSPLAGVAGSLATDGERLFAADAAGTLLAWPVR